MQMPRKQIKFLIKREKKPSIESSSYLRNRITLERIKLFEITQKKKKKKDTCANSFLQRAARERHGVDSSSSPFFKRVARDNGALRCIAILEQWGIALHPALILPLSANGRRCTSVLDGLWRAWIGLPGTGTALSSQLFRTETLIYSAGVRERYSRTFA